MVDDSVWLDLEERQAMPRCDTKCSKGRACPRWVACVWEGLLASEQVAECAPPSVPAEHQRDSLSVPTPAGWQVSLFGKP
jgi:hypothetical protein